MSSELQIDTAQLFDELRQLRAECGNANKHDQAIVLITACILNGINTYQGILDALMHLGFKRQHIAIVLREEGGNDPHRHRWHFNLDRRFILHDDASETSV